MSPNLKNKRLDKWGGSFTQHIFGLRNNFVLLKRALSLLATLPLIEFSVSMQKEYLNFRICDQNIIRAQKRNLEQVYPELAKFSFN